VADGEVAVEAAILLIWVSGGEEYLGPLSRFWWFNDTHLSG
jgi:hypothetical protein